MNLQNGKLSFDGDRAVVKGTYFQFALPRTEAMREGDVTVGFRPEHLTPGGDGNVYKAPVEVIEPMGSEAYVYLKGEKGNVIARVSEEHIPKLGQELALSIDPAKLHLFEATAEGKRLN